MCQGCRVTGVSLEDADLQGKAVGCHHVDPESGEHLAQLRLVVQILVHRDQTISAGAHGGFDKLVIFGIPADLKRAVDQFTALDAQVLLA